MATQAQRPSVNGTFPRKPSAQRTATNSPNATANKQAVNNAVRPAQQKVAPVAKKAHSVGGEMPVNGVGSAYAIMASRIANRVAEMAESITFVERPKPQERAPEPDEKRKPRKLEMRFGDSVNSHDHVQFSAPFLDNTLQKMLLLQNRMLRTTAELSKGNGVDEKVIKEHAAQSAELSRIIAMICAEKARQGA